MGYLCHRIGGPRRRRDDVKDGRRMIHYPITFKAAILERLHEPLHIDEVRFDGPLGVGQVLVKISYSGICGKQIEEIQGTKGSDPYLPHLLGHEGSGIVIDVGPGVRKVVPGEAVVLHWLKGSGIDAKTPLYWRRDQRINAGWVTTFNEYGVISENRLTPIPKEADLSVACLLGCAVTTGVGVILNEANLHPGDSVAVFGCGGVGLNAIQGAAMVQGYPIIAVDRNPESRQLARRFGATHAIDPTAVDVLTEIKRMTGGQGVQVVIVAVGNPEVIEVAVQASTIPGAVFLVGVPPTGSKIQVDPFAIHGRRTLLGSYGGGTVPDRDIARYLDLYAKGCLKLKELIFDVVPLEQIHRGIAAMLSGKPGRCVVRMMPNDV